MKTQNKTLEFLYQETSIQFLVNIKNENVMINATEMAKPFGKRTDNFLQLKTTKEFIEELKVPDMSGTLNMKIVENRGRNGIYFCQDLAVDFAMWLDVKFRVWVSRRIRESLNQTVKQVQNSISIKENKELQKQALIKKSVETNNTDLLELLQIEKDIKKAEYIERKATAEFKSQFKMDL